MRFVGCLIEKLVKSREFRHQIIKLCNTMSIYLAKQIKNFRGGRSIDTIEQGIRFRAWLRDRENGRYVYSENSLGRFFSSFDGKAVLFIEQWTGFTDKEGKNIYEGDVVTTDRYPYIDEGKQGYVGVVMFCNGAWNVVMQLVDKTKRGISDGIGEQLEDAEDAAQYTIIGNEHTEPYKYD
jgi:hypothetical protein